MSSKCFHCDLPIPAGTHFCCTVLDSQRPFCCAGCMAIAQTLAENNLAEFYKYRGRPGVKPKPLVPEEILQLESIDNTLVLDEISSLNKDYRTIELGIEGITCAACGWLIEKGLKSYGEVAKVKVNVSNKRAILVWDNNFPLSPLLKRINKLGYKAFPFSEDAQEKSFKKTNQDFLKRLLVSALGMMQVMTYALAIYIGEYQDLEKSHQTFLTWISALVASPVVFYSAQPFYVSAWNNLKNFHFGMNLPVSIAIFAAYTASIYSLLIGSSEVYFDSVVMFTFFLLIGRYLEHRARYQALLKQQNFSQLIPNSVRRLNIDNSFESIPVSIVEENDILIIPAGGVIPVDGILVSEKAEINQAVVTGEFMPSYKQHGDCLTSGSSNSASGLTMRASHKYSHSFIRKLIALQQHSEHLKPDAISIADKLAQWYVLVLLLVVSLAGIVWYQIDPGQVFPILLSVLVVSCPCALSLAMPAAYAATTSKLSASGLMIKNKNTLKNLAGVDHIYFDKTGTLTSGNLSIKAVYVQPGFNKKACIQIAASLEKISNHPIAKAFDGVQDLLSVSYGQENIGEGVSGEINSIAYRIGKRSYAETNYSEELPIDTHQLITDEVETGLYLFTDQQFCAYFVLQDDIKPDARATLELLKQQGYEIALLSGDSQHAVSATAKRLGIEKYFYETSPKEKLNIIDAGQTSKQSILMVGDGLNDVGALSQANVSITLATGTQLSKSASDAVLVSSQLNILVRSLASAKQTQQIIRQNVGWAIIYNLIAIPFAVIGLVPAWLAAIGMSVSSLAVVLNSLRLRK